MPLALLALWALLSSSSDTYYFPPLTDILEAFADTWLFERVGSDVVPSLVRLGLGYGIACIVAVALGLALGSSRALRAAADPAVQFLRSIPPPALLPFGILVLGVGTSMKVFIIAFVCLWPVLLNTIDGVAGVDPTQRETARVYGIGARDRLLRVTLPAAAPQIFAGMRTSLSLALILMVISEMVASSQRDRLLHPAGPALVRDHRDVVGDPAARDPGVRSQRRVHADRAAGAALAPRRAGERPGVLMLHVEHLQKSYGSVEALGRRELLGRSRASWCAWSGRPAAGRRRC